MDDVCGSSPGLLLLSNDEEIFSFSRDIFLDEGMKFGKSVDRIRFFLFSFFCF